MDQNQNGIAGEPVQDQFTASFNYDATPTLVVSTGPTVGSLLAPPFTTLDLYFNAPIDPSTVNPDNLSISQGSVTAANVVDPSTVEYSLAGISAGTITIGLAQGVLKDANENPVFDFSGSYLIPTAPPSVDWTTYQGNALHNGYVAEALNPTANQILWSTVLPAGSLTDLAVGDGNVYVSSNVFRAGTTNPNFFAINAATGAVSWQQNIGSNYYTDPPAYSGGMVYVQTSNTGGGNYLWLFDATTGAQVAQASFSSQGQQYSSPTPADGSIYTEGGYYGGTYAYSPATGAQLWYSSSGGGLQSSPSVSPQYVYLYGSGLETLDPTTGAVAFETADFLSQNYSNTTNESAALGTKNDALVTNNNRVISFNASANGIDWQATDQYTGQVTVANGVVYVRDGSGIAALSEATGARLWSWSPLNDSIAGRIIATDNMLFASGAATTYAIDLRTHQTAWTVPYAGHLALDDGRLYIAGSNGAVTAIGLQYASAVSLLPARAPNPSDATQPLSFTATVAGGVPNAETVSLVDISKNNAVVATGNLSNGSATLTVPAGMLLAGTHNLIAVYGGDASFAASESAPNTQTVQVVVTGVQVNGNLPSLVGGQRHCFHGLAQSCGHEGGLRADSFVEHAS